MVEDRAALKRTAQHALMQAGQRHLVPASFHMSRRSPRSWFKDREWWRPNVWFSPSGFSIAAKLDIGVQYYWNLTDVETMLPPAAGGDQRVPGIGRGTGFDEHLDGVAEGLCP